MTRRGAVLTADANDLLDLIIEMTAFAADAGVFYTVSGTSALGSKKSALLRKPEFSAAPEMTPIQFAAEQAEVWVAEGMSGNAD